MLRALYIDFNSFFASVEQQVRLHLRGKPVAVVPSLADSATCIAASVEAKFFGVKTGTKVGDARRLCAQITFIESRAEVYVAWHHKLIAAVELCAPIASVNSIDEMWVRLSGRDQSRDNALKLAREIKAAVSDAGDWLRCSIGIAPNEFLAKTASDMKKPNGLVIIEQADLPEILFPLRLTDFVGIGRKMHIRLLRHGIASTADLLAADLQTLRRVWGGVEGERLWARLKGFNIERPPTQQSSIGHSHVLAPHLRTWSIALSVLSRLLQKAAMRLRHCQLVANALHLYLDMRDGVQWHSHAALDQSSDTLEMLRVLDILFNEAMVQKFVLNERPIKIGVTLSRLQPAQAASQSLFATAYLADATNVKALNSAHHRIQLHETLDTLNRKFGKNAIYYGDAFRGLHAASARIAFNYIPDLTIE